MKKEDQSAKHTAAKHTADDEKVSLIRTNFVQLQSELNKNQGQIY